LVYILFNQLIFDKFNYIHLTELYIVALLHDVIIEFTAHLSVYYVVDVIYKCLCFYVITVGHSYTQTVFHKKSGFNVVKYING
jgi:hypothetical protein